MRCMEKAKGVNALKKQVKPLFTKLTNFRNCGTLCIHDKVVAVLTNYSGHKLTKGESFDV